MQKRIVSLVLKIALGTAVLAAPALAQNPQFPLPPQVEKGLAARASHVSEVTLGKNMLGFAARFMDGKDKDDAATRQLIQGLDGIYVREYTFDKDGQFSMDEVDQLRKQFETSEWSPMVRERERRSGVSTDVMVKLVNGENRGIFILEASPRELTIVQILGPIRMEDLGRLEHFGGLGGAIGPLAAMQHSPHGKSMDKEKDKKGGNQ
jgi:hypothetical protein